MADDKTATKPPLTCPSLDAALAERLGWVPFVEESTQVRHYRRQDGKWVHAGLWRPSEDIACAWSVVNAMRERGLLLIMNDTGAQYRARFFSQLSGWSIDEWIKRPDASLTVWADTAPLAIAQAALAVLEGNHAS